MELSYGNSNFVDAVGGGVCCYGDADGDMDRSDCMMQINKAPTMTWCKVYGGPATFEEALTDEKVYKVTC
jgi:long-chain acyl-CoA synthetase